MDLFKEQTDIEARMADRGIERYRRLSEEAKQSGEATRSKAVQTVLDSALVSVVEAIEAFRADAATGRAGRRHTAIKRLSGLDPFEVSFLALHTVLDGMARDMPMTPLATKIGRSIELEARFAQLGDTHSGYVKTLMADLDGRTRNATHRRAVLSKVLREKGDQWEPWGERDYLHTGLKLIELVVTATGLFEVCMDQAGKKRIMTLHATERFKAWLHSLDTRFALMAPEYLPCVVPPKDWSDFNTGGYHTDALAYPPTLVKTSSKLHRDAIKRADLSKVLSAVNAIQRTPWAINTRVLEVVLDIVEQGGVVGGLPDMENVPLPAQPVDIETNEAALKGWKREAARTYEANRRVTGRRIGALKTIQVAEEFADYESIYFPYQLDFRGRVYPIPQGLNPQGNDLAKGLLHFAEGDELGVVGAFWFEVHGANCFGVDKVSFEERRKWVADNWGNIVRSAADPLDFQWWAAAENPFCFLAWCFEYVDWADTGCVAEFRSRIAVAMDGSCNGIQHYSAMLRDPRGGAAVNLVPSDKPQDIYGEVAKVVSSRLTEEATSPPSMSKFLDQKEFEDAVSKTSMAGAWSRYGIDRKITKRPVMVLPYGGTQRSCLDYVYDAVKERGEYPFPEDALHKATVYLGGVVWGSIGEVVVAARLAMGWLKAAASVVAKENRPLVWTTPSGFPVVQAYPVTQLQQIECAIFGNRIRPSLSSVSEDKLDSRRQANGIAPNFVHSLDAAALIDTVNRASAAGVTKFAMIHDSYGTTAGQTAALSSALRDAFVDMYEENDVLEDFLNEAVPEGVRDRLPSPPFVGGLDLQSVKSSAYFFA